MKSFLISKQFGIAVCLVVFACIAGLLVRQAWASEPLPERDGNAEYAIQKNQKFIHDNQTIVDEYNKRKQNNAVQEGILSVDGYSYDYKTNKAIKPSFQ